MRGERRSDVGWCLSARVDRGQGLNSRHVTLHNVKDEDQILQIPRLEDILGA